MVTQNLQAMEYFIYELEKSIFALELLSNADDLTVVNTYFRSILFDRICDLKNIACEYRILFSCMKKGVDIEY